MTLPQQDSTRPVTHQFDLGKDVRALPLQSIGQNRSDEPASQLSDCEGAVYIQEGEEDRSISNA